jgi:hypothetical protein
MYAELREEKILVLTSCNVISIGFDEPSVEVGLMLRPTQSSALHLQQIGRVMRISPQTGKQYGIILDQAGNLERLGFPEDIKDYYLPVQQQSTGDGSPPPKKPCPQCGYMVLSFVVQCPECNHQWITERVLNLEDLVEIYSIQQAHQIDDVSILKKLFHGQRLSAYMRWLKSGKRLCDGNSPDAAKGLFKQHCGRLPQEDWCRGSTLGLRPTQEQLQEYFEYLQKCAKRSGKRPEWIVQEFEKECGPGTFHRFSQMYQAL